MGTIMPITRRGDILLRISLSLNCCYLCMFTAVVYVVCVHALDTRRFLLFGRNAWKNKIIPRHNSKCILGAKWRDKT